MVENSAAVFDGLLKLLTVLTPILVAGIGAREARHRKNAQRIKDAETALANERKEAEKQQMDSLIATVEAISNRLSSIEEMNSVQQERIEAAERTTRLSGLYVHELAQLVTVLAEGVRDQHLDGNITKAIADFRAFEMNALGQLISGESTVAVPSK